MLTENKFIYIMLLLGAWYKNFYFNTDSDNQTEQEKIAYQLWFDAWKHIDDLVIEIIVKQYCSKNEYPPSSPTSILKIYDNYVSLNKMTWEQAWEIGYQRIKDQSFDVFKAIASLETEYPDISKTISKMRGRFYNLMTADIGYVKNRFRELYEEQTESNIQLTHDEKLKIDG